MAKQDFLDGGFIGKLGNVVGQGWKNKRYIRTYVIPADPKTPGQMACRSQFKQAVSLAQEAMNLNARCGAFDSEELGEFQLRIKTAKLRLQAGLSEGEALPLFPDGWTSDTPITGVSLTWIENGARVNFRASAPLTTADRGLYFLVHRLNTTTGKWADLIDTVRIPNDETFFISLVNTPTQHFSEGAYLEATTADNRDFGGESITLYRLYVTAPDTQGV